MFDDEVSLKKYLDFIQVRRDAIKKDKKRTQFTDLEKEVKALLDTEFDLKRYFIL